jgi:hypothetical protein
LASDAVLERVEMAVPPGATLSKTPLPPQQRAGLLQPSSKSAPAGSWSTPIHSFNRHRDILAALAARHAVPAIYELRENVAPAG